LCADAGDREWRAGTGALQTWDEIRTAYHVARAGTVSGAAEALGVHHATVIRHVDALEARLGVRLFQRHARGYTPTEAGEDLLRVARATDDQFAQLASRLRGRGQSVSGELVITALPGLSQLLAPSLVRFQAAHPDLVLRLLTDTRLLRLEYGEAHVAIRAGARPQQPDNVVQPLSRMSYAMFAAPAYLEKHGRPGDESELDAHSLVGPDDEESPVPFLRWLARVAPREAVRFRSRDMLTLEDAVIAGAGLGFLPVWRARRLPEMVEVLPPRREWDVPLWLVTHVDLHRSAKVQAALAHLKAEVADWQLD
jgi:DNA-binding transcriptional LysR family regulator